MNSNHQRTKFEKEFEEFLKDSENSSIASIYRELPSTEPAPALDNAILMTARRALRKEPEINSNIAPFSLLPKRSARVRHRWIISLSSAAGIVLAAGLGWRAGIDHWGSSTSLPSATPPALPAPSASVPTRRDQVVDVELRNNVPDLSKNKEKSEKEQNIEENFSQNFSSQDLEAKTPLFDTPRQQSFPSKKNYEKHTIKEYTSPVFSNQSSQQLPPVSSPPASIDTENLPVQKTKTASTQTENEPQALPSAPPATASEKSVTEQPQESDRLTNQDGLFRHRSSETSEQPTTASTLNEQVKKESDASPDKRGNAETIEVTGSAIKRPQTSEVTPKPTPASSPASKATSGTRNEDRIQEEKQSTKESSSTFSPPQKEKEATKSPKLWIAEIRKLFRERRTEEALETLELFRKHYPDHELPADLRRWVK